MIRGKVKSSQLFYSRIVVCFVSTTWLYLYVVGNFGRYFSSNCLVREFDSLINNNQLKSGASSMLHLGKGFHQLFFSVPVFLLSSLETVDGSEGVLRIFDGALAILGFLSVLLFWMENSQLYTGSFPTPSQLHAPETLFVIQRSQEIEAKMV